MSNFYSDLAGELHSIADDLATLTNRDLPELVVTLTLQPRGRRTDNETIAFLDTLGTALLGNPGVTAELLSGDAWHHRVRGGRGPVSITAFEAVTSPEQRAQERERAELEAEVARLRAELAATIHGWAPAGLPADVRTCAYPGDQEHDHEMCRDAVEEAAAEQDPDTTP